MKLTVPLIRKLHSRLKQRQRRRGDKGVVAVGLGWAMKAGKPDKSRPGPILVYAVKKKKKRPPKGQGIRPTQTVTLPAPKGKPRRRATFKTDVIEVSTGFLTGLRASCAGEAFTAGAVVAWGSPGATFGGFLTVAHGVPRSRTGTQIVLRWQESTIAGRVIGVTSQASWLDAALIQISDSAIADGPLAPIFENSTGVDCRTVGQLVDDARVNHPRGLSFTTSGPRPFVVSAFFPSQDPRNPILRDAPQLRELLIVQGVVNEFEPGTSGSPWAASPTVADAIQVGGYTGRDPDTGEIYPFFKGIGQPLSLYLDWAKAVVREPVRLLAVI